MVIALAKVCRQSKTAKAGLLFEMEELLTRRRQQENTQYGNAQQQFSISNADLWELICHPSCTNRHVKENDDASAYTTVFSNTCIVLRDKGRNARGKQYE